MIISKAPVPEFQIIKVNSECFPFRIIPVTMCSRQVWQFYREMPKAERGVVKLAKNMSIKCCSRVMRYPRNKNPPRPTTHNVLQSCNWKPWWFLQIKSFSMCKVTLYGRKTNTQTSIINFAPCLPFTMYCQVWHAEPSEEYVHSFRAEVCRCATKVPNFIWLLLGGSFKGSSLYSMAHP